MNFIEKIRVRGSYPHIHSPTTTIIIFIILYYLFKLHNSMCITVYNLGGKIMNLICSKQKLQEGISIVTKAITGKTTMPV